MHPVSGAGDGDDLRCRKAAPEERFIFRLNVRGIPAPDKQGRPGERFPFGNGIPDLSQGTIQHRQICPPVKPAFFISGQILQQKIADYRIGNTGRQLSIGLLAAAQAGQLQGEQRRKELLKKRRGIHLRRDIHHHQLLHLVGILLSQ